MEIDRKELADYLTRRARAVLRFAAGLDVDAPSSSECRVAAVAAQQLTARLLFLARGLELEIATNAIATEGRRLE